MSFILQALPCWSAIWSSHAWETFTMEDNSAFQGMNNHDCMKYQGGSPPKQYVSVLGQLSTGQLPLGWLLIRTTLHWDNFPAVPVLSRPSVELSWWGESLVGSNHSLELFWWVVILVGIILVGSSGPWADKQKMEKRKVLSCKWGHAPPEYSRGSQRPGGVVLVGNCPDGGFPVGNCSMEGGGGLS